MGAQEENSRPGARMWSGRRWRAAGEAAALVMKIVAAAVALYGAVKGIGLADH